MQTTTLHASKRDNLGTRAVRRLRREGQVPLVLYGRRRDTVHLSAPLKEIEHLLHTGMRMVNLEVGGVAETALLKEIQYDAMGDHLLHVDLARIDMNEKVTVRVPVTLHGLAKGVVAGGTLEHVVQDIEVNCLPGDIPERIRVEVANLDIGQILAVRDITPPAGVEFVLDPETPIAIVHAPAAEKEAAPAEAAEQPAEPEVIGRRAAEEGEGEESEE